VEAVKSDRYLKENAVQRVQEREEEAAAVEAAEVAAAAIKEGSKYTNEVYIKL